jgi:hypothetical protein
MMDFGNVGMIFHSRMESHKNPWFQSPPTRSIIQHMAKVAVLHILILHWHVSCRPSLERSEFGMQGTGHLPSFSDLSLNPQPLNHGKKTVFVGF